MTLIIGIKCQDGIVMGADGAATFGALGNNTIRQETTKLDIIEDLAIVGVSGPVGLGQRIKAEIRALLLDTGVQLETKLPTEAMRIIRTVLWQKHIGPELQVAQVAANAIGQQLALQSALASTVVCFPLQGLPCMLQFDQQGAPEEATDTLPFIAIGSGQPIADPFLAFLRRIFWRDCLPSLNDGIFSTLWALEHAIQTHPGGVADPKQVVVLEKNTDFSQTDAMWKARQLAQQEFEEHMESVKEHEKCLADFHTLGSGIQQAVALVSVPV